MVSCRFHQSDISLKQLFRRNSLPRLATLVCLIVLLHPAETLGKELRILAIGDSLFAGYGLKQSEGFTSQMETALRDAGHSATVINAAVSGDTTSGGLARLDWLLGEPYDAVILFLGANDALRAIPVELVDSNLRTMLEILAERQIPTFFIGMRAPRNLGPQCVEGFDAVYTTLATEFDVVFYPFFLEGVATDLSLNLDDGIHPNADGIAVIVEKLLPYAEELVRKVFTKL